MMTYIEKLYKRYEESNEGITFERWLVNEIERLEAKYTSAGTLGKELISPCCKTKLRITNDETIICDSCGSEWDSCGNLIIEEKKVIFVDHYADLIDIGVDRETAWRVVDYINSMIES